MMKYKVNLMVFLFVSFQVLIGCVARNVQFEKSFYPIDKEKEILEKVSNEIIVQNADYINQRKRMNCKQPLFLKITQQKGETNGFKYYSAFFSESSLYGEHLPTYLWNKHDIYVVVRLDNRDTLLKSEIPENLLKKTHDGCFGFESSWLILICDDTYKTKVIDMGLALHVAVKQFQDFSCDVEDAEDGQIIIEDAEVDTELMEELMKSLGSGLVSNNMAK